MVRGIGERRGSDVLSNRLVIERTVVLLSVYGKTFTLSSARPFEAAA